MKQIMTYVSPIKKFNNEHQNLVKLQIDNSLDLGWKPNDIILATNFSYEYRGVKSIKVEENNYCFYHWPATKIYTLVSLFKAGVIKDDLYWYHDFDCYQLNPFTDIGLGEHDAGLTNYSRMVRLCSASIFFKKTAEDIFVRLKEFIDSRNMDEETGIMKLINDNMETYGKRVKLLNITYAFHKFNLLSCDKIVEKPIKVAHFHATPDKIDFYIHGNNKLKKPILPERLIKIFNDHGYK